jgi:hypothetical protein
MIIKEEKTPQQIAQEVKIQSAKIILSRRKANLEKQLEKTEEQNNAKEERIRASIQKAAEDAKRISTANQISQSTIPMRESEDNFMKSFFYGDSGQILDYLINKRLISNELISIAKAIKKDPEFSSLLKKIKIQMNLEEPNRNLLIVLKNKINNRVNNYKKI